MKQNATIITRTNPYLNFGQTGEVLGFNEFSDEVVFKPHGDRSKYNLHWREVWYQKDAYNYEALNKALDYLTNINKNNKQKN